ncbi:bile acid:sodium symporter family protein [Aquirufa sp. ROCK-SH2]
MQASLLSTVILPIALAIIMMGLGLSLQIEDFKRIIRYPKAMIIGLLCQMILLPALCFIIAKCLLLSPELSVGLMLIAAAPGGPSANLYSHIAKGDVALNVSLTALNSLLSIFSIAIISNFAMQQFMATDQVVPLQFGKVMEVCMIVIIPISLGMIIRNFAKNMAQKMDKPVKVGSALFLATAIILTGLQERDHIFHDLVEVGFAALLFNLLCLGLGYWIPRFFQLPKAQAIAIGMEIGIHNGTLAIFIALTVIGNSAMAIPAVIYSFIMFITAGIFGAIVRSY